MASLMPVAKQQYFIPGTTIPLVGGKLYTYAAGTSNLKPTYQDAAGTIPNTNPITLDSTGSALIFWDGAYKIVLKDALGNTIYTVDNYVETMYAVNAALSALQLADFTALRSYTGAQKTVFVTGYLATSAPAGIAGMFTCDDSDTGSADNGGTIIVANNGKRWKRVATDVIRAPWFGAKGDGATDDTAAVQAAINAVVTAGGGEVFLPAGTYKISAPLVMDTGAYGKGISLRGAGRNTVISQTGASKDAVQFSTTQFLQNSYLKDLQIVCAATAGHCVNIVYGCTTCRFDNVELVQNNPAKACVYGDYTNFGGGIYDTKFRGGSWYCAGASTEAGFRVIAKGTIFNENVFENLRCYNSKTLQFFYITTVTTGQVWLVNNTWKNINFEACNGGGFHFDAAKNWKLENVSFWDAGGPYTNHLIDMVAGAGYEPSANTFINVGRNGDSVAAGVRDIRILNGQDSVIINCFTQSGDTPSYDFNLKRVTVIGRLYNVLNGNNIITILPDGSILGTVNAFDLYGDTLHIGGRSLVESARLFYTGGYAQMLALPNGSGIILASRTAGGADAKLVWDTAEFYPLTDNSASCGIASGRWTQVYAATGSINTSDENSKDQIGAINAAVLRAWSRVDYCQYKFKDAVARKGDGARWHIGVIAQRVKAAFEAEGLDPFAFGVLCYDEWPDKFEDVLDADGKPTGEKHQVTVAGNRYGVRYEEALALECAYLRSRLPA